MNADFAAKSGRSAKVRGREGSLSNTPAGLTALYLTRRGSLILVLLLSLGLWAAIWVAVASLASSILG